MILDMRHGTDKIQVSNKNKIRTFLRLASLQFELIFKRDDLQISELNHTKEKMFWITFSFHSPSIDQNIIPSLYTY